jgi:hypothetical protein
MRDGECTVTIQPKEMVTLRGAQGAGVIVDARDKHGKTGPAPISVLVRSGVLAISGGEAVSGDIDILDLSGRLVRRLAISAGDAVRVRKDFADRTVARGTYILQWSCTNGLRGRQVVMLH